jgi:hypothetical protein
MAFHVGRLICHPPITRVLFHRTPRRRSSDSTRFEDLGAESPKSVGAFLLPLTAGTASSASEHCRAGVRMVRLPERDRCPVDGAHRKRFEVPRIVRQHYGAFFDRLRGNEHIAIERLGRRRYVAGVTGRSPQHRGAMWRS